MWKKGSIRRNNYQITDISYRFVFLGVQVLLSSPLFIHLLRSAPIHFQNGHQILDWLENTPPEHLDTILALSVMTIILQLILNLVIVQFIPKFLELKIYSRNWFYSYLVLFILLTPLLVILHLIFGPSPELWSSYIIFGLPYVCILAYISLWIILVQWTFLLPLLNGFIFKNAMTSISIISLLFLPVIFIIPLIQLQISQKLVRWFRIRQVEPERVPSSKDIDLRLFLLVICEYWVILPLFLMSILVQENLGLTASSINAFLLGVIFTIYFFLLPVILLLRLKLKYFKRTYRTEYGE